MKSTFINEFRKLVADRAHGRNFLCKVASVLIEAGFMEGVQRQKNQEPCRVVDIGISYPVPIAVIQKFENDVSAATTSYYAATTADLDEVPLGELGGVFFGPSEKERAIRNATDALEAALPKAMILLLSDPTNLKAKQLLYILETEK